MAVSPFRSYLLDDRQAAADKLVVQRKRELSALERRWKREKTARKQRLVMTRIQATRNNIVSWQDYISQGCPRVANATTLI